VITGTTVTDHSTKTPTTSFPTAACRAPWDIWEVRGAFPLGQKAAHRESVLGRDWGTGIGRGRVDTGIRRVEQGHWSPETKDGQVEFAGVQGGCGHLFKQRADSLRPGAPWGWVFVALAAGPAHWAYDYFNLWGQGTLVTVSSGESCIWGQQYQMV
jgi:hypothetical protein